MSKLAAERAPMHVDGVDLRKYPIDCQDAFLLSRMDGQCTIETLADMVGLGLDDALDRVRKLRRLGLATWDDPGDGNDAGPETIKHTTQPRKVFARPAAERAMSPAELIDDEDLPTVRPPSF